MSDKMKLNTITFECDTCCCGGKCKLDVSYDAATPRSEIASPESCSYGWFSKVEWKEVSQTESKKITEAIKGIDRINEKIDFYYDTGRMREILEMVRNEANKIKSLLKSERIADTGKTIDVEGVDVEIFEMCDECNGDGILMVECPKCEKEFKGVHPECPFCSVKFNRYH